MDRERDYKSLRESSISPEETGDQAVFERVKKKFCNPFSPTPKRFCPACGSTDILYIIYGMPTPETVEKVKAGKCRLGGCCVDGDSPKWYCNNCKHEF